MAIATALAFVNSSGNGNDDTRKGITKNKILVFSNAYHGATLAFPMSLVVGNGDKGSGVISSGGTAGPAATNLPHDFVMAPYNNIPETRAIIDSLDPSNSLATILFEPMQGAGGCRTATKEFASYLRQVADEHCALLIADEVMTSRLGPAGLCVGYLGIKPDIMTLGKWVGGEGEGKGRLSHAGTFNNNLLTMVAGFEGLGIYTREKVEALNALGNRLRGEVWSMLADRGIIGEHVRTGGELSGGFEFVEMDTFDRKKREETKTLPRMFVSGYGSLIAVRFTGEAAEAWQALFYHHMLDENIYLAMRATWL
ncbi:hypothetical protein ACJ73_00158 [Blastomyces percursus]|uniref:Uncharacterized protein n=1 Tax=Blastomyces percursus TaxID=1658174 RepID=A0A1J9QK38_9EURO|nr:hypothetical protein ACJ73_00158 [Blastomyces percursus]